jgi:two-component system phosphate regulon sensor histidine kinase PhoR
MAETLSEYGATDAEDLRRSLDMVQQQTRRMGRLIDDLLLLSRLETGERPLENNPVNVPSLLQGLAEEARTLSGGRHDIVLEVDEALRLNGDENELRSAFSNLVSNAVKYTPDQGRIAIRWYQHGEEARVAVSDSGIGVPPHHIPRLTERFYRVDGAGNGPAGGTGLGLAIVKHVLSRHHGQLTISSQPEHGSTFTCVFREFHRLEGGTDRQYG